MKAYLQHRALTQEGIEMRNINGELSSCHFFSHRTEEVQVKVAELPWQKAGKTYTATGYGERIATKFMVKVNNVWRRVYYRSYSNACTLFIGKNPIDGILVTIHD